MCPVHGQLLAHSLCGHVAALCLIQGLNHLKLRHVDATHLSLSLSACCGTNAEDGTVDGSQDPLGCIEGLSVVTAASKGVVRTATGTLAACRRACKEDAQCSYFTYDSSTSR